MYYLNFMIQFESLFSIKSNTTKLTCHYWIASGLNVMFSEVLFMHEQKTAQTEKNK